VARWAEKKRSHLLVFEELIIALLQFVFELLLEFLMWLPWDSLLWSRERRVSPESRNPDGWLVPLGGTILGLTMGGISLVVLPNTLLVHEGARLVNIVAAPLVSGGLAALLARRRERRGQSSSAKLHFWFAFAFSLSLLVVRFTWAERVSVPGTSTESAAAVESESPTN
jgi:hypothetical protein